MKTAPAICRKKMRYRSKETAEAAAQGAFVRAALKLRVYRCQLCRDYHLTSRTKGMKTPSYEFQQLRPQ